MDVFSVNLYQAHLLDHYKNPRHKGVLERADFSSGQYNPSCADSVSFQGMVKEGSLEAIAFQGSGCVISQASASIIAEYALGKSVSAIAQLDTEAYMQLLGIELGPNRLKCALLPLHALQEGLKTL